MQMICDGVATKNEVLQDSIEQYQEVYVKAKREFETVVQVRIWLEQRDFGPG